MSVQAAVPLTFRSSAFKGGRGKVNSLKPLLDICEAFYSKNQRFGAV